ncbi:MAG: hypothetical protein ACKPKO_06180, partial [Candidatus Fonsibacter sp.]
MDILVWSMKIMLGGVHPFAMNGLQPLDAQRSLLVGRTLGASGGLFQARVDWAWYQQFLEFPPWSGKLICWRCKSASDDSTPYWTFSMNAKWRTKRHKYGTFCQAQRLARSTVHQCSLALVSHWTWY